MTERSDDRKKQLGRILLQRKVVTPDELTELLREQKREGGRLASTAVELGRADAADVLSALSEQQGCPAVDLTRREISLAYLALVPLSVARKHGVMPLSVEGDRLLLAMADPSDLRVVEEISFVTGKQVVPHVALASTLRDAIEFAYAAAARGESRYVGTMLDNDAETSFASADEDDERDSRHKTGSDPLDIFDEELSRPLVAPPRADRADRDDVDDAFAALTETSQVAPLPLAPPGPVKRRILLVDSSEEIRQLLARVFRERDYEVFESARGQDALSKVRSCAPDVLVLDAVLPELHGFELCRRIKNSRRYGHIPVIMTSAVYKGWRFAEDLRRGYGVYEFLEKPFRIGSFIETVERAIRTKGKRSDTEEGDVLLGEAADRLRAGIEAYARGDVELAVGELKKGIAVDPLAFRLHYHLGLLYGKQENVFEAIEALEIAADLRPRDFSTLKNLAVLYQRAGFRLKSTELWERALGHAPDDATRANIKSHLVSLL